ncbi:hypothetical protein [Actinomadura macrotermitis]|uniref:Uncharacterized protein n=1 Tax=Actinomadura macrotermitis TaxID=2585200 RepID=A0A7K0BZ76_9ACTN|nr:hypothetical protein [Actinomadura macrotermitis]MQY06488.1 hypothetical protein [Actinomadura macrotermitis]
MIGLAVLLLVLLTAAAVAGLRSLYLYAQKRRDIRWAHTVVRFCGNGECGVCRSRCLSREVPRLPVPARVRAPSG